MDFTDNSLTIEKVVGSKELPRFIYKYFTDKDNRLKDALNNQAIWFSNPLNFNDPFDCQLVVDTNNTDEEILRYADYLCNKTSDADRLKVKLNLLNADFRHKNTNENIQNVTSKAGVSCFSKVNDSILMWAHYSNSHKGYCLKFDLLKATQFFMVPVIVEYKKEYPYFNYLRDWNRIFNFNFGNKFCDWEYEKEIRIVRQEQGNIKINPEAIVEISFGINCTDSNIKKIKKICKSKEYNHITFQKARRKKLEFGIEFDEI